MVWNQERINLLIELWMSGKSASAVAKELGNVSRNAVIGKVHRLGVADRVVPSKQLGTLEQNKKRVRVATHKSKTHKKPMKVTQLAKAHTRHKVSKVKTLLGVEKNTDVHAPRKYERQVVLAKDPAANNLYPNL